MCYRPSFSFLVDTKLCQKERERESETIVEKSERVRAAVRGPFYYGVSLFSLPPFALDTMEKEELSGERLNVYVLIELRYLPSRCSKRLQISLSY